MALSFRLVFRLVPHQRLGLFNPILALDPAFEGQRAGHPVHVLLAPGSDLLEMIDAPDR